MPLLLLVCGTSSAQVPAGQWTPVDPGFRAVGITSDGHQFWLCGVNETIASSPDGVHWTVKNHADEVGSTLLGIQFFSATFGYAWGTGGALVTTTDGGETWDTDHLGSDTFLLASLSDEDHGILRTANTIWYLDQALPSPIQLPDAARKFTSAPFVVAISAQKMAALLTQGTHGETGLLVTTDGGKTWSFSPQPGVGIADLLRVDGQYWASGHELVSGGVYGVPLAINSDDGVRWTRAAGDLHACQLESCGDCTPRGCLASANLLVDFFHAPTTTFSIPNGPLAARWAATPTRICTLQFGVFCADLGKGGNQSSFTHHPKPHPQALPSLAAPAESKSGLHCLSCPIESTYIDDSSHGEFKLQASLQIAANGTVESAKIDKAPTVAVEQKVQKQVMNWLFEPPTKDGQPVRITTETEIPISVVHSR